MGYKICKTFTIYFFFTFKEEFLLKYISPHKKNPNKLYISILKTRDFFSKIINKSSFNLFFLKKNTVFDF